MNWNPFIFCCSSLPLTIFLPEESDADRKPKFGTGGGPTIGDDNVLTEASPFITLAISFLPSIANVPTIT